MVETDTGTIARARGFIAQRTASGVVLHFGVLRAPGVALSLALFALICGLLPAVGLSAMLPLNPASASAMLSLALIGGFAAPFILAAVIFLLTAVYLAANSLHVDVDRQGIYTERRVLGRLTKVSRLARADIQAIEPRIGARYQNVFSGVPRYALVAKHRTSGNADVVVAEDIAGQALMQETQKLIRAALEI